MEWRLEKEGKYVASGKEFLQFVLKQLSDLEEITYRAMMGEYILYYRKKIVDGIYDDRILVKPTKSAIAYMSTVAKKIHYNGAKEMLFVGNGDSKECIIGLFNAMYVELLIPKAEMKKLQEKGKSINFEF